MADLLLSSRRPSLRVRPAKSSPQLRHKEPASQSEGYSIFGTVRNGIRGANDIWQSWKDGMTAEQRRKWRQQEERKQILVLRMKNAESFQQWETAAQELDVLEGNDQWKLDSTTGDYNAELVEHRLRQLDEARDSFDLRQMMHLIRTALSRDLGGMGNVELYRHTYTGTKNLIERYVESTLQTIEAIVTRSGGQHADVSNKDLLEGMILSRQSFGRSALLLSGGGAFGMSHVGVLKSLFENDLLPRIISGASAGSIVCAVMCTRTDEEMPELIQNFPYGDLGVFGPPNDNVLDKFRRLLTDGSWSDVSYLTKVMRDLTWDLTFQEAYNRTRRILNICVSTASIYELPRLLNYVTAPNVMIWSAVASSCAVPLVFNSSPLLVKDPVTGEHQPWTPTPQHFIDGSVDNDLPMTRLSEMFNVNHFIVSQVNPHVVPFLVKDDHLDPAAPSRPHTNSPSSASGEDWTQTLATLARDETLHRLHYLTELSILPNLMTKLRSMLSQKYSGDINILPQIDMHDLPRLLENPTPEFMLKSCLLGERATWVKLRRIRDRCAIELALDRAVHRLRARVIFNQAGQSIPDLTASIGNLWTDTNGQQPRQQQQHGSQQQHPTRPHFRRHRRRSGGSMQLFERRRMMDLNADGVTDEDTVEEELQSMQLRRDQPQGTPPARRAALKRQSKSHINVHQHRHSLHSSAAALSSVGFDFTAPITTDSSSSRGELKLSKPVDVAETMWPQSDSDDDSLGDDQETTELTELGRSSSAEGYADAEQGTEESDLGEPSPGIASKGETNSKGETDGEEGGGNTNGDGVEEFDVSDDMFGPDGRLGGDWD